MDQTNKKTAVAIGKFDGLHRGHQALLSVLKGVADKNGLETVVFSFSPPPAAYFSGAAVKSIYTAREKREILDGLGIETYVEYPFGELADINARSFIEDIIYKKFKCRALAAGESFRFGKDRAGNLPLLKHICAELDIQFLETPLLLIGGNAASSSSVVNYLNNGGVEDANALLGRPFSISGMVDIGRRVGRTLGFPTVNISVPAEKYAPKDGVYAAAAEIDGDAFPGVANVGVSPTFKLNGEKKCETHLINFDKDVYGKTIKIKFYKFIRDEITFASADRLKEQITEDVLAAKKFFGI